MSGKAHHVMAGLRGGWAVRQTGASRASRIFRTQDAAIAYAREVARRQRGVLYIHRPDGSILGKDSYGDVRSTEGQNAGKP